MKINYGMFENASIFGSADSIERDASILRSKKPPTGKSPTTATGNTDNYAVWRGAFFV